jgi:hypothetical protein
MKLRTWIFVMVLLVVSGQPVSMASESECKLKYDFQYLFKWVAGKMDITIDFNKPQPKLVMTQKEELWRLYEEKTGKKLAIEKNGVKMILRIAGFYRISENTIYMKDSIDPVEKEILEETLVHELVHYFQDFYRPSQYSLECLKEPFPLWNCPWEREAYRIEKLFRLEHGLKITDSDLEFFKP